MRGWPARRHTHGAVTSSNDRSRGRRAGGGVVVGPVPLLFPLRREEADQRVRCGSLVSCRPLSATVGRRP